MNICFFGVGGVGGYFGSLVTQKFKGEHSIFFVARGSHKEAILKNGLTLRKAGGSEIITVHPDICTDSTAELPVCDTVILSVKGYDLADSAKSLRRIVSSSTLILPLLNGVDIYERIRAHLTEGIVLPSCVYVGTHIESPGVINQKGGACRILMGKDPRHPDIIPETLFSLLKNSQIDYSWEEDVQTAIWNKYMFIASFGLVGAVYGKTLGQITDDPESSRRVIGIMHEIKQIGQRRDLPLDENSVECAFRKAQQFPYESKTSFQRDVESKGKVNEGDLFGGTIIRYGKEFNIPTPNTEAVYEVLKEKQGH